MSKRNPDSWNKSDLFLTNGSWLNPLLVKKQGLTLNEIEKLKQLHEAKDQVMRDAHDRIKQIEFEMQDVWGFPRNENRHTHRFLVPYPGKVEENDE